MASRREKYLDSGISNRNKQKLWPHSFSIGNVLLLMGRKVIINTAQTSFNIKIPKNDRKYFNYKLSMHCLHSLKKPKYNFIFTL